MTLENAARPMSLFSQRPIRLAALRNPLNQRGEPRHVEAVHHEHPRHVGIGGHGLIDVHHEVRFGACRTDGFGEHRTGDNIPIADQPGRAVPHVFELVLGDLARAGLSGVTRSNACRPVISLMQTVRVPSVS